MMKISVLGCGRWGAFQAWYAARCGHDVLMWGRPGEPDIEELISTRRNSYLELPSGLNLTTDPTRESATRLNYYYHFFASAALLCAMLDEFDLSNKPFCSA
jgi:glycerol-3-phosphate dehydrogenase (NAD(P)+)